MNMEHFRELCLSLPHVDEYLPFDEFTLAFRVGGKEGKIFCLMPLNKFDRPSANLKCDPEYAVSLREQYSSIIPGYHMNKKHWNTVFLEEGLSDRLIREMVADAHSLVYRALSRKLRESLEAGHEKI